MISKIQKLSARSFLQLLFYPFFILIHVPIHFCIGMKNACTLFYKANGDHLGFTLSSSINNLFYVTEWINLSRFGRNGKSPYIGLGAYSLNAWFYLSEYSLKPYIMAGALTTLCCSVFLSLSTFVWSLQIHPGWVFCITITLCFSSTIFAMAFTRQNYQIISWMFLPITFYFLDQHHYLSATISLFFIGLTGLTAFIYVLPLVIVHILQNSKYEVVIILLPAFLSYYSRLAPLFKDKDYHGILVNISKLIGAKSKGVKYVRTSKKIEFATVYFIILYLFGTVYLFFLNMEIPVVNILGLGLYILNQRFVRIADDQSLILYNAMLFAFSFVQADQTMLTLLVFWLVVNPLPFLLSINRFDKKLGFGKILTPSPVDLSPLKEKLNRMVSTIPRNSKIYCAFNDPVNEYEKIFDGYRIIHEATLNVASSNMIHAFPDWWAVFETNYEGAPHIWGREILEVVKQCRKWEANYALIYQDTGTELDEGWLVKFKLVDIFDWGEYLDGKDNHLLWPEGKPAPRLFLLKLNAN